MSDGLFQTDRLTELAIASLPEKTKELLKRADEFLNKKKEPMTGTERITQERLEQKIKHNHSVKSDWEQYPDFELAMVAEAVLTGDYNKLPLHIDDEVWEKAIKKPYEQRLVIAGALIAAEIDRLNFKE